MLSAVLSATGLAQTPTERPITRNMISSLSAQEAARLVLGPIGDGFISVEQATFSPLQAVDPSSVLDILILTSKAVPAQGRMCRFVRLVVTFVPVGLASDALANSDTPVRPLQVRSEQRFVAVDSAAGVRIASGRDQEPIETVCERVLPGTPSFRADSEFEALDYTAALDLVIRVAARQGELFFALRCELEGGDCANPRDQLSRLSPKAIQYVGGRTCLNSDRDRFCYQLGVSDGGAGDYVWRMEIVCALPSERPVSVFLRREMVPRI